MPDRAVIEFAVGVVASIVVAPLVAIGLRHLFALFLTEATDLFTLLKLKRQDALDVGRLLARHNVVVALLTWLLLLTCRFFELPHLALMGIALAGLVTAVLFSVLVVWSNLEIAGSRLWAVALLAFTGGNLPLIVFIGAVLAML